MVKSHVISRKPQKPELDASSRHRTLKRSSRPSKSNQPRRFTIQQTDKPTVEIQVDSNNYHAYTVDATKGGSSGEYLLTLGVQYRDDDPDSGSEDEEETVSSSSKRVDSTVTNILKHIPKKDYKTIKSLAPYFIMPAVRQSIDGNKSSKQKPKVHTYTRRMYVMSLAPSKSGLPELLAKEDEGKQRIRKFSAQYCSRVGGTRRGGFVHVTDTNCVRAWLETERTAAKSSVPATRTKQLYYIAGLLTGLQADSVCYGISGGAHVRIMEDYFVNNTKGYLIGTLYDGASNKVPKHCGLMNKLVGLNKIPSSLLESLSTDLSNYASLSAMTIMETGFTFYEKFGYMVGVLTPALQRLTRTKGLKGLEDTDLTLNHMTYMDTYSDWLDQVYDRLCILYTPINKLKSMITKNKPEIYGIQTTTLKTALSTIEKAFKLRMSINKTPFPTNFSKMTLYVVYQLCKITTDVKQDESVNQLLIGKYSTGTVLFYMLSACYIINSALSDILMHKDTENFRECVKFTRVWDTPANNFTLELHRQLPGVKPEYLAERFTLPVPDGESHRKTGKKLSAKAELALQESIRTKQDRIIQALKTRTVTESPTITPDL